MSRFKKFSALATLLGWVSICTPAYAIEAPLHSYEKETTALIAEADTTTSRSFTLTGLCSSSQGCYSLVAVYLWHKTHNTLSKVEMTCYDQFNPAGFSASVRYDYVAQTCDSIVLGDCDSVDAKWHKDVTGAKLWGPWRIRTLGMDQLKCTLTFTGGSAGDTIRVDGAKMTL